MTVTVKPVVSVEEVESDDSMEEVESDDSMEDVESDNSSEDIEPGDDMDIEIKEEVDDSDEEGLSQTFEVKEDENEEAETENKEESDEDDEIETSDDYDSDIEIKSDDDSENEDAEDKSKEDSELEETSGTIEKDSKTKQKTEKKVQIAVEDESDSVESESDDDGDEDTKEKVDSDAEDSKSGLANVMAQILSKSNNDDVLLSKAKKDYMVKKEEDSGNEFDIIDAEGNIIKEVTIKVEEDEDLQKLAHKKHLEKERLARKFKLKPDFQADYEKERKLRMTATQGVVQLFTAIEKHKNMIKQQKAKSNSAFADDDFNPHDLKESFLNILDQEGEKLKRPQDEYDLKKELKHESSAPKKPKWNVFADNFYKEPTLQGWDMKSDEED